jgi:hypothetical protein
MKAANGSPDINESSEMDFSETIYDLTSARSAVRLVKDSDGDMEAQGAGTLVRQLSEAPRRELEDLVGKLMTFLKKLDTDTVRIQLDIEEYTELNQRVMQLTNIVADSVGKLPDPQSPG